MKKTFVVLLSLVLASSLTFAAPKKAAKKSKAPAPAPILIAPQAAAVKEEKSAFTKKVAMNGSLRLRYSSYQSAAAADSFSLSRARIRINGEVAPDVSFLIQPDFAGLSTGGTVAMADAYAEFRLPLSTLRFGQFLLPFAYDSAKYKTIYGTGLNPSYYGVIVPARDYGLRAMGKVGFLPGFNYDGAIVNGTGGADVNKTKDITGRVNYKTDVLDIGLSGYYGKAGAAELLKRDAGIDVEYKLGSYQLVSEALTGGNIAATAKIQDAYLQLSGMFDNQEPLVKYEIYDPDSNISGNQVNTLTMGYNYYLDKSTRLMFNYNLVGEETTQVDNNSLLIEFQTQI